MYSAPPLATAIACFLIRALFDPSDNEDIKRGWFGVLMTELAILSSRR
jgi:hypothetical protein